MNVYIRFTDGSCANFIGQFKTKDEFWSSYKEGIASDTPFLSVEEGDKTHYFSLKEIVSVIFSSSSID